MDQRDTTEGTTMGYTNVTITQPQGGVWPRLRDMIGHRLVIFGTHSIIEEPDTMNPGRTRMVATVDYVDLDDGKGGEVQWNALFDKPGIVNKLRVGQSDSVMGRIAQGDAKAGQSPPFLLTDHQDADVAYFRDVWYPTHAAELAGSPKPSQPAANGHGNGNGSAPMVATQYPNATYQQPAPAYQAPAPTYQQPPLTAPTPPLAYQPPAPVAATVPSAEAVAAYHAMIASGQIAAPAGYVAPPF